MLCGEYAIVLHGFYKSYAERGVFGGLGRVDFDAAASELVRFGWFSWFDHHTAEFEYEISAWANPEFDPLPLSTFSVRISNGAE